MNITFSPILMKHRPELRVDGDILYIDSAAFDFSSVPEGASLPSEAVDCPWLASDVERIAGELHLTLLLPHGPKAPPETLFPEKLDRVPDGPVAVPPYDIEDAKT
jgi:hypothetical protein